MSKTAKLIKMGTKREPLDQRIVKPQPAQRITRAVVAQWVKERDDQAIDARAAWNALFAEVQK
jgi:hypothetical protein